MQKNAKKHRIQVADFWDDVLNNWRADPQMRDLPEVLRRWRQSYQGEVNLTAYPEAFIGDLRGEIREPRLIVLGLNPGIAYPELQGSNGIWTQAARKLTYSRSSELRTPFNNENWTRSHSRDSRYFVLLDPFARRWLEDNSAGVADILNIEMFPFHSNRLTHKIRPPHDTIKSYVWAPLREMEEDVVFAFGADWVAVCENLPLIASYGPYQWQRELKGPTYGNWQVNVYSLETKRVVVSWQKGFSGPPGDERIPELRRVVDECK